MKFNSPEAIEKYKDVLDFLYEGKTVIVRGKTNICIKMVNKKPWVYVSFAGVNAQWLPSFEELFYIIKGIAECEKNTYNLPQYSAEGKLYDFIGDTLFMDVCYEELAEKYKLPDKIKSKFEW